MPSLRETLTDITTRHLAARERVRTSWAATGPPTRRRRAFVVVSAAVLTQMMTAPGQTVGISVFVDHLVTDLDLSRSGVSAAYLVGTGAGALSLPLAGRLIDRRGLRWATTAFAAAFGAVLVAMAGVTGFASLALGFAGTRMLGQGALTLTASTTIAVSFDRHRGTAMGIKTALGGGLMSLIPLVAAGLIAAFGWRTTFAILGISVWLILLPLARWVVADPR
ncbi:MAG: MFS transporter, partial [Acidimicrobiales bacterium]